jgi:hypothetical protein
MKRVVFENGHCLLPEQPKLDDYACMLDDDVRAIAGSVVRTHDTDICLHDTGHHHTDTTPRQGDMTLCMENICGGFRGLFENVAGAGALVRPGAIRVGQYVKHRQFVGTHYLFHSVHGRIAYRTDKKMWSFKGCRSLDDLVKFVRDLTEDTESMIHPVVSMLSVTLRTDTALVIDPVNSLMRRVLERLYSHIVRMQTRMDDTNNLFFMDVICWNELLKLVEKDKARGVEQVVDADVEHVRAYMAMHANDVTAVPTVSIGYTRKGVFFIRITFPRGCECNVNGSLGVVDGITTIVPSTVCTGGIEPFVKTVTRFIFLVLVKMRVIGVR